MKFFMIAATAVLITSCTLSRGAWECSEWKCSFNTNGESSRGQEESPAENGEPSSIKESD
jgi:hypothetical protein